MTFKANLSRRRFLKTAVAGTCGAAIHSMIRPHETMMALASPLTAAASNKVLIVVNLAGGCSYNIAPIYHGVYRDLNPTISYGPENSLALSGEQGIHPALTSFKETWDEGGLALLNLVGYPNPNRSHDESTDIWFRGSRQMGQSLGGWGARLTCQMSNIFGGVSLGGSNLLITGDCNPPRSFASLEPNALGEDDLSGAWGTRSEFMRYTRDLLTRDSSVVGNENSQYVKSQADNLQNSIATMRTATNRALPSIAPIAFPNSGFGTDCRDAARLLNAPELNTQFIYLQRGGFDTHSDERNSLNGNLQDINGGLRALIATAKALGRWNDVTIITMSEFSRTFENGSQGTDHGHAAPMFVMGGSVKGGRIVSPAPTPEQTAGKAYFHDYHIDFRNVFNEAVAAMGYNSSTLFPESYAAYSLGLY